MHKLNKRLKKKERRSKIRKLLNAQICVEADKRIIEAQRERIKRNEKENAGLRELVNAVDAVLYEIGVKYGYRILGSEGTPGIWRMTIRKPDPKKLMPYQVETVRDGDEYSITVRSPEFAHSRENVVKREKEEREAAHGDET